MQNTEEKNNKKNKTALTTESLHFNTNAQESKKFQIWEQMQWAYYCLTIISKISTYLTVYKCTSFYKNKNMKLFYMIWILFSLLILWFYDKCMNTNAVLNMLSNAIVAIFAHYWQTGHS